MPREFLLSLFCLPGAFLLCNIQAFNILAHWIFAGLAKMF